MTAKKLLSLALTFIIASGMFLVAHASSDIPDGYIPIYTAEDLNNIRNELKGKYILMNDIDLSSYENWVPIGKFDAPFTGELDGNGFYISNLSLISDIETEETNILGLFGFVTSVSISDVTLKNVSINVNYPYSSTYFVGGVVAYCSDSKIDSCEVKGDISIISGGNIYSGGIVGYIDDKNSNTKVTRCISDTKIDVIGIDESFFKPAVVQYTYIGGIAGFADLDVKINNCINKGDISVNSINVGMVGSIIGYSERINISGCSNIGLLKAEGTCKTNDPPILDEPVSLTLWDKLVNFFELLFEKVLNILK